MSETTITLASRNMVHADGTLAPGWVEIRDGYIAASGTGASPEAAEDVGEAVLAPGFIDQHCHGGGGAWFTTTDSQEALAAARFHRKHGTTSVVASLVTATSSVLLSQVSMLKELVQDGHIVGTHLEGPWLSARKCGAHDPELLRPPDPVEVQALLDAADGTIAMVTLAPEWPGSADVIRMLVDNDVIVAVGHTDASYETTIQAVEAGATVATHWANRMTGLGHRKPGSMGALLENENVVLELICDGVHLHPAVIHLAGMAAGWDRVALITDATAGAGAPDGRYSIGELDVLVLDGVARLVSNGALAGSTLTMDRALQVAKSATGQDDGKTMAALTSVPARVLGLDDRGSLAVGKRADLVVIDDRSPLRVMQAGKWV